MSMNTVLRTQKRLTRGFILGIAIGFFIGAVATWSFGWFATRYHPIEEAKMCMAALRDHPEALQPQTREYLKARLYWNADVWISRSWMQGWDFDFGPVDDALLAGLDATKDASGTREVYEGALRRHGIERKDTR